MKWSMRAWLAAALLLAPVAALAVGLPTTYGGNAIGAVLLWLNGSGNGVAVSSTNPLPTVETPVAVTYVAPAASSVGTSSATIVAVPGAKLTKICNKSTGGNLWLNPSGATAVPGAGDEAQAGGGCVTYSGGVLNANGNVITGISDNGTLNYTVTVGN